MIFFQHSGLLKDTGEHWQRVDSRGVLEKRASRDFVIISEA